MNQARRLFFGLWPNESVRQKIQDTPYPGLKAKTIPRENWHMTLVFLGPTSSAQQDKFERLAERIRVKVFNVNLDITGKFIRAGVAWLGCEHPHHRLVELQRMLEAGLRETCPEHLAFALSLRPYCPHVTLYRHVKKPLGSEKIKPIGWAVNSFSLIESRPSEHPVYRVLNSWNLQ